MIEFIENIKNNIDFFLRNCITFSRKNYFELSENKENVLNNNQNKVVESLEEFDLKVLNDTTVQNYFENIYFLNLFNKTLNVEYKQNLSVLDIGSKNWYYAKSEYIFFKNFCKELTLKGIELDYNRLNSRMYSREEIAKFHIKNLKNVEYIKGDLLEHEGKYDYIIWILPFIVKYPLVKWGLPLKYFQPEKMLFKAYSLLNKNGRILIVNQGESEHIVQKELNQKLNLKAEYFGKIKDNFSLFKNERYYSIIEKT